MNCKWKYFVVLNNGKFPHNIVEAEEIREMDCHYAVILV